VLTSIAGHGHDVAVGLEGRDDAHLVLGRDARKDRDGGDPLLKLALRHLVDGLAGEAARSASVDTHAELAGDRHGRLLSIARNHDDVDASSLQSGNGVCHPAPRRVHHGLKACEHQLATVWLCEVIGRSEAVRHRHNSEALRGDLGRLAQDGASDGRVERRRRSIGDVIEATAIEDCLDRALQVKKLLGVGSGRLLAGYDHVLGL